MSSSALLNTVLVTGGGGFLGSHIVRKLLTEPGCKIYSASRNPSSHPDQEDGVVYEAVDIANQDQVAALFQRIKPQVVIHTTSPNPLASPREQHRVNVEGTKHLLRHAVYCVNTRAFIFTGSDSGMFPNQDQISEEQAQLYTASHNAYPYGKTKGIADALVLATNGPDLRTISLRVPGLYGDHDYKNLLPQLLGAIRRGEHKTQVGDNSKVFEVLHVHKAAEAHIAAAKALLRADACLDLASKVDGEAFFISDGHATPYWDFFRRCYAAAGASVEPEEVNIVSLSKAQTIASLAEWVYAVFTLGYKKPQMRRQNMDYFDRGCNWSIEKAKERLGYEPLTVEEQDAAIKSMMDWGIANLPKP
ncbi:C-3 sterol dehydrogenase/C-4 decarboxylase [Pochonia chlamydosporia 170]|uniref:C-3 sterol dehydrogenase/C-4 decarboxylase n=1 Tax=Pochonia chlamydosporia 170 TaxID=1380566 RepID=A0A179F4U2_METCM|nr:C-3 sterol dehydrogenase/C-4 decarboxylase [Pochonia chlamydosporia 170]OAQ60422.1 C-3 sterol dehydrogenase/C-4 decarboxylase [Pochonia chlamydosporia 170]